MLYEGLKLTKRQKMIIASGHDEVVEAGIISRFCPTKTYCLFALICKDGYCPVFTTIQFRCPQAMETKNRKEGL